MPASPALRLRAAVPAALALGALAVPATAQAQAQGPRFVVAPKPCYVSVNPAARESMSFSAAGFSRHAVVVVRWAGRERTYDADAAGVVTIKEPAPYQRRGQRSFAITLTEATDPAATLTATVQVTALAVRVLPRHAATSDRVRLRGRGFTAARPIWGHYVLRGRVRRTVGLAPGPSGACGTFSVRRRLIPVRRPRLGRWVLQVDQQRRWSPQPDSVFVPIPITVQRVAGAGSAREPSA